MTDGRCRGDCSTMSDLGIWGGYCCSSCHEDAWEGYSDLLELPLPNGDWLMVCCFVWEDNTINPDEVLRLLDEKEAQS